jgi:head-tail adaptor
MAKFVKITNGWPAIEIGALRHPVTIQSHGPSSPIAYDAAGPVSTWNDFLTAMAAIDPVRGTDVIRGGQITTQLFLTIALWYQPGILPSMRVVSESGSIYVIQSVEDVMEMHKVLLLNCIGFNVNE